MRVLPFAALWVAAFAVVSAQSGAPAPSRSAAPLPPADPGFIK